MNEERLLILKMVEEGRITAEEGVELLDALSAKNDTKTDERENDGWRKLEKHGEEFAQKVEATVEKFSKSLEDILEGGLGEKLQGIPKVLAKIPFVNVITEDNHVFQDCFYGSFQPDLAAIPVSLRTNNGSITVEGWDQERYKLVVTQKIRGKDRETALQKAIDVQLLESAEGIEKLALNIPEKQGIIISYHLYLPKKESYILELVSQNGTCKVENLAASKVEIETVNSPIHAKQLQAQTISGATSNGRCNFEQVNGTIVRQRTANGAIHFQGSGEKIYCESTNGAIRTILVPSDFPFVEMILRTTNGSVTCQLPQDNNLGVKVNASTTLGKVNVRYRNFIASVQERISGSYQLKGEAKGDESDGQVINIDAKVSSGSITIIGDDEDLPK